MLLADGRPVATGLLLVLCTLGGCEAPRREAARIDAGPAVAQAVAAPWTPPPNEAALTIAPRPTTSRSFGAYACTDDCSGHEAGYQWAEDNSIDDPDDCSGKSESFIEGCQAYVEEQAESEMEDEADEDDE